MKNNLLIIGDVHMQSSNISKISALLESLRDYAKSNSLQMVFLGDIYHTHGIVKADVHEYWFNYFKDTTKFIDTPIVLVGNHDMLNQVESASITETPLRTLSNIQLMDRPFAYGDIGFMPYCHTAEMFNESMWGMDNLKVLFCHQEFRGFTYENGIPTNENSAQVPSNIPLVISGHIHKHQVKNNLVYLGAPYHQKKSDSNNPRHVAILQIADCKLQYINDFEHLSPKIELIDKPPVLIDNNAIARKHKNISLEEMISQICLERYKDEEYGRKILTITQNYLR